ncbi:HlyD family efflux transporter periplasmic adaptor subunit [Leptospira brenneri]|uniref:HlyD family efflux transporter periplasmic adaptor subunit n=1 Tax=Leptospira brenneri TaxID=2023182 RepID=A0A5F1Z5B7_9LEPT|nr:efflux RND transporter periplasmic adaptor subunit [Leptospira brenneri]TGK92763.1 HlyD family efflux transporter periplasmic adaptor subunit [Leptospira brenneri]
MPQYLALLFLFFLLFSCNSKSEENRPRIASFHAIQDGVIIKKSEGEFPSTISLASAEYRNLGAGLSIPVRISVVCVSSKEANFSYHFETEEQSIIYSEYLKSKAALYGAKKSYSRLKYLVENEAAAGKELNDAQVQLQQMAASMEENLNRLRMQGIPIEKLTNLKPGNILIVGDIPETKLNRVKPQSKLHIKFSAFPGERFETRVNSISDVIDPVSRTVKVLIITKNSENKFKPGMFGTGQVELENIEALSVPNEAVILIGDTNYIFKQIDSKSFQRVQVETGIETEEFTQILSGLEANDRVVSHGSTLLKGLSFGY